MSALLFPGADTAMLMSRALYADTFKMKKKRVPAKIIPHTYVQSENISSL